MRNVTSVRLLAVLFAAGSLIAVPLAGPASAVTKGTACGAGKTVANLKTKTSTTKLTGCTNPSATGGKGTEVVNFAKKIVTAKITWNKTGTTSLKITVKQGPKVNKCAKGSTMVITSGTVTAGTGAALKAMPKGAKFSESACYTKAGVVTLYPGSKVVIK